MANYPPLSLVMPFSNQDTLKKLLFEPAVFSPSCQVMDKYGDFYGRKKISELLGLDQAALDFSTKRKEQKRLRRDSAWSVL